jgi:hypothetical protein
MPFKLNIKQRHDCMPPRQQKQVLPIKIRGRKLAQPRHNVTRHSRARTTQQQISRHN